MDTATLYQQLPTHATAYGLVAVRYAFTLEGDDFIKRYQHLLMD